MDAHVEYDNVFRICFGNACFPLLTYTGLYSFIGARLTTLDIVVAAVVLVRLAMGPLDGGCRPPGIFQVFVTGFVTGLLAFF